MSTAALTSASMHGARLLLLLQLFSRTISFLLNQLLLRYTAPSVLGIAYMQLDLLLSTLLFLAREGIRSALLRAASTPQQFSKEKDATKDMLRVVVNLAWIPLPIGCILSFFLFLRTSVASDSYPHQTLAVLLYSLSALLELLGEPLYALAQYRLDYTLRARAEGIAVVVRAVLTLGIAVAGARSGSGENLYGVLAFAWAQFAYAITWAVVLAIAFVKKYGAAKLVGILTPSPIPSALSVGGHPGRVYLHRGFLRLSGTFTAQSLIKHLLTEADRVYLTLVAHTSTADQGAYAFVVNYGSLLARIVFQPVEDTSRALFARLLIESSSNDHSARLMAARSLTGIIKAQMRFLAPLLLCIAPAYTHLLVTLLAGRTWAATSAPTTLALYCAFVAIMAVNGILEAFVQAVATPRQLGKWMGIYAAGSVVFGAVVAACEWSQWSAVTGGGKEVVVANIAVMLLRILYCWAFVKDYFALSRDSGTKTQAEMRKMFAYSAILPRPEAAITALLTGVVTFASWVHIDQCGSALWPSRLAHVGVGAIAGCVWLGVTLACEDRGFLEDMARAMLSRRSTTVQGEEVNGAGDKVDARTRKND